MGRRGGERTIIITVVLFILFSLCRFHRVLILISAKSLPNPPCHYNILCLRFYLLCAPLSVYILYSMSQYIASVDCLFTIIILFVYVYIVSVCECVILYIIMLLFHWKSNGTIFELLLLLYYKANCHKIYKSCC